MTDTTHTPRPWRVEPLDIYEEVDTGTGVQVVAADETVICDNQTYYPQPLDPRNARLIAAAPDLLDACQHTLETIRFCRDDESWGYMLEEIDRLEKAIIKATT